MKVRSVGKVKVSKAEFKRFKSDYPSFTDSYIYSLLKKRKVNQEFLDKNVFKKNLLKNDSVKKSEDKLVKKSKVKLALWVPPRIGDSVSIFNEDEHIEDSEFATMKELKASVKYWKAQGYDVSAIEKRMKYEPKVIAQALKESLGESDE